MTTFLGSYERPRRQSLGEVSRIGRLVSLSEDTLSAVVDLGNETFELPVSPGKYVLGANVAVLESKGKPRRVSGPAGVWPDGLDADADAPVPVTAMVPLGPRELSAEEAQAIQDTADGLAEAQSDLADMSEYAGEEFSRLDTALDGLAAGVNGVTYSTEEPSEPGRNEGDTWFQMDGDGTAGFWRWNGTEWQPTEFEDTVLGDVTLGKLRAGNVIVDEGVIGKLWAEGISARTALFSRATIAARNMIPGIETLATYGDISAEDRAMLPLREFGVRTDDPSIWLQGEKTGWVWAQIPVTEGERYRFSVDVRATISGTVFYVQTRNVAPGGAADTPFDSWTDWERSASTNNASGSYPFQNVTHSQVGWRSYWSEATATATGIISVLVYANHTNGVANETGHQWFRNLRMEAMQDGSLWVDGAVNARHLNVVPEEGTGGMELLPPGLRIIPSDAEAGTAVSLRTDEENWLAFAKAGKSTFSVNPDGHLTAQQVDANESFTYRGDELSSLLDRFPRGVISNAVNDNSLNITVGTDQARLVANTFRTPAENRMVRVSLAGKISTYGERFVRIYLRQSTGNDVKPTNTAVRTWHVGSGWFHDFDFTLTQSVNLWGWPYDNTITLGVFLECVTTGETVELHRGDQSLIVEDVGPSVRTQVHTPWAPATGGGGGGGNETEPGTRDYTWQRKSSWTRSFLGNNNHYNYGAGRAYQGLQPRTPNGNLKSMIGWPSLITTLSDATIKSIKVKIKNDHTYAYSGATAYIGLHGRTTAPATFAFSVADVITASFTRSQTRTLTIPSQYHAGFKNGDYTGIVLYTSVSSNARYGYWDGTNAELIIEYEK